ncbi:ATP synthase subunit alpha, chloroplastic-like [Centruroides sculpturatus]|uniref:ATP synthase subunit alpha, chloroplastic-like n=1 Tax=Centruroides sculpturatus TaxID=218467 RepID=UPI000C6CD90B|nr:ATP synthase subunit alpha, chloroplastic-like [Centruroides sculpturatus]
MALKVTKIKDYIVQVTGKYNFILNEIVRFPNQTRGIVMRANEQSADIALFEVSIVEPIQVGDTCKPTGREFEIEFTEQVMGNIINIDGELMTAHRSQTRSSSKVRRPIFRIARPIYARDFVNQPLMTGLAAVDWAIPIGRGQRELILGDRQTGKTAIALNAMVAQKGSNTKVIYVAIGQKKTSVLSVYRKLEQGGVLENSLIVSASAETVATKKWLAPFVAVTIAEYLQETYGDDVLIVYDDLSKHADAYRELALLIRSAPAREAYPGDIFYLHSKLLERAGRFNDNFGGGSITALPIVQTEAGDITSYIPTNVISITDGQIFTSKTLFNSGQRPAIDVPFSVSRVGSAAQTKALASVSGGLKLTISQYEETRKLARLTGGAQGQNATILENGRVLTALLIQPELDVLFYETGTLLLTLYKHGYLNFFEATHEIVFIKKLLNTYLENDFLGRHIRKMIATSEVKPAFSELVNREIVLPMLKYFLIMQYPHIRKNDRFVELYRDIRDDGRIYKNVARNLGGQ